MNKNFAIWLIVFVIGAALIIGASRREQRGVRTINTEETTVSTDTIEPEPEPIQIQKREPIRHEFTGVGTDFTEPFQLRDGMVIIHTIYRWSQRSENFIARLQRLDGQHILQGLLVNELTNQLNPSDSVDVRRMIQVRSGEYVIQVQAERGNQWIIGVFQ
jgi:hypothetical protein